MKRLVVPSLAVLAACSDMSGSSPELGPPHAARTAAAPPRAAPVNPRLLRRFRPLRAAPPDTPEVTLGRLLYFEPRLSRDRDVSCNSCHPLDRYGADARPTSIGTGGASGRRNAPTVYHADGQIAAFWDGRAADLTRQAGAPIVNPVEMGLASTREAERVLAGVPGYAAAFAAAYPDDPRPISFANATRAIAAFERGLVTPARWDRFLEDDHDALSPAEIEGFLVFAETGCVECHTGELVGGSMFQKAGRARPWPTGDDRGREEVTGDPDDRQVFKVPTLRNVRETAPYFHDGSAETIEEAVRTMAIHQLDVELDDREIAAIVTWLGALTGPLPDGYVAAPALPPN